MSAQDSRLHGSPYSGLDLFTQAKELEPEQNQLKHSLLQPGLSRCYAVPHHLPSSRQGSLQDLQKSMLPLWSSHRQYLPGKETIVSPLESVHCCANWRQCRAQTAWGAQRITANTGYSFYHKGKNFSIFVLLLAAALRIKRDGTIKKC